MDMPSLVRNVSSAQWSDPSRRIIIATIDGQVGLAVPDDPANSDRRAIQGWQDAGNSIADPAAPAAIVPEQISDVQFFQQLAIDGEITQDEAEAAVSTGAIPQRLAEAITHLPADQQFGARMKLKGATIFARHSPLTELLAQLLDKSSADADAIWMAASKL